MNWKHTQVRTTLKIIQHNVQTWITRKNELSNYYNRNGPDVILLNATCSLDKNKIKIYNYNIHQCNAEEENHAGIAVAIKKDIQYQIIDQFQRDDFLGMKIMTNRGPVKIFTTYVPTRRNYVNTGIVRRIMDSNEPVYLIADINASHPMFGYTTTNNRGRTIKQLIERGVVKHVGPEFTTLVTKKENQI